MIKVFKKNKEGEESVDIYQIGSTFKDCDICPEMVVVPAGSFMMGSPENEEGRSSNEGPQHEVTILAPLAVGKYPVTRGQYKAFVDEAEYNANDDWRDTAWFEQDDNHPVVYISWKDAKEYVHWLTDKTKHQYRLLSEAEWEYVARARTTTAYHFGDTITLAQANYSIGGTDSVGSYPANDFGLHDVHGNVWEWVEDCWHDNYDGAPTYGSAWVSECNGKNYHVVRGGSWDYEPRNLRSACRGRELTDTRDDNGFRVARVLIP